MVNYRTFKNCKGRGKIEVLRHLGNIVDTHNIRGFNTDNYHGDNKVKKLERDLEPAAVRIQAAGDHELQQRGTYAQTRSA